MGMKSMYDLRDMLCKELDELARKGELGAGDLEIAHKLTATIKNIDKIDMMESDGYSGGGDWEADMRGAYGRGSSYALCARTLQPRGWRVASAHPAKRHDAGN